VAIVPMSPPASVPLVSLASVAFPVPLRSQVSLASVAFPVALGHRVFGE
jgi:hypothetical protein